MVSPNSNISPLPSTWDQLAGVVFDFDGVIVDSVTIKTEAFKSLFAEEREHLAAILDLHMQNGGMSRYRKFDLIFERILKRPLSAEHRQELGDRFEAYVLGRVLECPSLPGVPAIFEQLSGTLPLYICSGTPQDELVSILQHRGLAPYFRGVFGSPRQKADILSGIARTSLSSPSQLVFVGDAKNDLEAAEAVGASFIGLYNHASGYASPFAQQSTFPIIGGLDELLAHLPRCPGSSTS